MQEQGKLNQIFPQAFLLWSSWAEDAKGQGLSCFTETEGWKTKSWGNVGTFGSSPKISPNAGNVQNLPMKLKDRNGKLLEEESSNFYKCPHLFGIPGLYFLFKNPETFLTEFHQYNRAEGHQSECILRPSFISGFFLSSSLLQGLPQRLRVLRDPFYLLSLCVAR